jgi:hypothetical protein
MTQNMNMNLTSNTLPTLHTQTSKSTSATDRPFIPLALSANSKIPLADAQCAANIPNYASTLLYSSVLFKTRKKMLPWGNFFIAIILHLHIIQVSASDCAVMHEISSTFTATENGCCQQEGIVCDGDNRVTSMYVNNSFNLL